ncbi:MAG: hypothetical protein ACRDGD_02300, partial [Candidatus Limnocylindria bacterium]
MLSRRRFIVMGLAAVTTLLAACAEAIRSLGPSASPPSSTATAPPSVSPSPTPAPSPTGPPLRERIAQMLLVGFRGLTVADADADATRRSIATDGLGGVLLFSVDQLTGGLRNVASPDQVRALVSGLASEATVAPLLVAIDQE